MNAPRIQILCVLNLTLFLSGCTSFKYTAIVPSVSSPERFEPVRFYVAEADGLLGETAKNNITFTVNFRNQQGKSLLNTLAGSRPAPLDANAVIKKVEQEQLRFFNEAAAKKYPGLFSSQAGAVPLKLQVTQKDKSPSMGITITFWLCTLGLCPMVLPYPLKFTSDISMQPSVATAGYPEVKFVAKAGKIEQTTWMTLLSPLGLIPIPGKADEKWSVSGSPSVPENGNIMKCSEEQFIRLLVRGNERLSSKADLSYLSFAKILASSLTSLDQRQIELLKEQYYKSMRVY